MATSNTPAVNNLSSQIPIWRSWLVVLSGALFFFFTFNVMNIFNAINPYLLSELHFTPIQLGNLYSSYFWAEVFFLLPAGIILDRFSVKKILLGCMATAVICTYLFSLTSSYGAMWIYRFINGGVAAFCLLGCVKLATRWFPSERLALAVGFAVTMAMLGGTIAQTPVTILAAHCGWRWALAICSFLGMFLWVIMLLFVRDYPQSLRDKFLTQKNENQPSDFWASLWLALRNLQNFLGGLYTSFLNLPIFLIGGMWGSLFLIQDHQLNSVQASYVDSLLFIGTIIGSPLVGWISDRMRKRKRPMVIAAIFSLATVLLVVYLPTHSFWIMATLFFLLGLFTSAQVISYSLIAESNTPNLTASANGFASILIMGGGLWMPIFGWLMQLKWDHKVVGHMPVYAASDYHHAMMILVVGFTLGLIASFLVKETHCLQKEEGSSSYN